MLKSLKFMGVKITRMRLARGLKSTKIYADHGTVAALLPNGSVALKPSMSIDGMFKYGSGGRAGEGVVEALHGLGCVTKAQYAEFKEAAKYIRETRDTIEALDEMERTARNAGFTLSREQRQSIQKTRTRLEKERERKGKKLQVISF